MGGRAPLGCGWGWGGEGARGEGSPAAGGARAELTQNPVQHLPAPGGGRSPFGGASSRGRAPERPRSYLGLLRHPPRKVGRRCWCLGRRTPSFPPRSAVTQPGRPRRLSWAPAAALSGPPPCIPPGRPLPIRPVGLAPRAPLRPVCQPTRTSTASRLRARSCSLRTGRGWGLGRTAPLHPTDHPPLRKCLSTGTSLTSQGSDVKGRVPVR